MSDSQFDNLKKWGAEHLAERLPFIVLPSGPVSISDCAKELFGLIAPTRRLFTRGGAVMELVTRDDGMLALDVLTPPAARSYFEKFGKFVAWRKGEGNEDVLKPVVCARDMAEALLKSKEAETLPRVRGLINCPVVREIEGKLAISGRGYDEATGLLVTDGERPPVVPLAEAVAALWDLHGEFDFQSEGDKGRAVASMLSFALKAGGFINGRVPADVAEADESQSGKTYRQKVMAAIYNERLTLVTCKQGGVGSIDESLSQALVAGRPFVQFDNFRGRFESAHLESFMTADGLFPCRVPFKGEVFVQPENYLICLTSNGVETTPDFARRSNIIRIKKKPPGFQFKKYPEGALLDHVRARQAYYLGCVVAVVEEWHRQGKLRTNETRHDFREWVQVLDWIMQNIFKTAPIMDGHLQAQQRVSNPALVWLRRLVLAVDVAGELNRGLTATEIYGLCEEADVEIPGLQSASEDAGKKKIGVLMGKLFREGETLEVEGFMVTREERFVARDTVSSGGNFKSKIYTVAKK